MILNQSEIQTHQISKDKLKDQTSSSFKELPIKTDSSLILSFEKWILVMQRDNFDYRTLYGMESKSFNSFMNSQVLAGLDGASLTQQNIEKKNKLLDKFFCNLEPRDLKVVFSYELFKNNMKHHLAPLTSQSYLQNLSDNCRLVQVL